MNPKYAPLFQPFTLNNGVTVKNRLAVAPMTHFGSHADGLISDQERTFLGNRAGDMGLFISAATLVQDGGKAFRGQPEATGEHCLDSLKETAQIIQKQGAKSDFANPSSAALKRWRNSTAATKSARPPAKKKVRVKRVPQKWKNSSPPSLKLPIWRFAQAETFAKKPFPQQPEPKHRFSAVSAPNTS